MGGVVSAQASWSDKGALEFNPNNNKLIQGIMSLVETVNQHEKVANVTFKRPLTWGTNIEPSVLPTDTYIVQESKLTHNGPNQIICLKVTLRAINHFDFSAF